MTSANVARQKRSAPDEWELQPESQETEEAAPDCGVPSGIGHVEEGSLEEAMWRELGALPPSRKKKARR